MYHVTGHLVLHDGFKTAIGHPGGFRAEPTNRQHVSVSMVVEAPTPTTAKYIAATKMANRIRPGCEWYWRGRSKASIIPDDQIYSIFEPDILAAMFDHPKLPGFE